MALKYRFNLKDIKLEDFKVYLLALFKAVIPKKKIRNASDLQDFIQKKISMDIASNFVQLSKNKNWN